MFSTAAAAKAAGSTARPGGQLEAAPRQPGRKSVDTISTTDSRCARVCLPLLPVSQPFTLCRQHHLLVDQWFGVQVLGFGVQVLVFRFWGGCGAPATISILFIPRFIYISTPGSKTAPKAARRKSESPSTFRHKHWCAATGALETAVGSLWNVLMLLLAQGSAEAHGLTAAAPQLMPWC